jgi:DNA-binding NarL/FixJ family response regulator
MEHKTRIIIYEDNHKLRRSLCMLLDGLEDYDVVGNFANCSHLMHEMKKGEPDIVVMDIDMPGINGIQAVRKIKEFNPDIYIMMYTVFEDDDKIFDSLCAGANGYILKKSSPLKFIESLNELRNGGSPLTPSVARKVLEKMSQSQHISYGLSVREKDILKLLVQGYTYKKIASSCHISLDTVRSHVRNIYTKLHVNCGREAVAKALKERII